MSLADAPAETWHGPCFTIMGMGEHPLVGELARTGACQQCDVSRAPSHHCHGATWLLLVAAAFPRALQRDRYHQPVGNRDARRPIRLAASIPPQAGSLLLHSSGGCASIQHDRCFRLSGHVTFITRARMYMYTRLAHQVDSK
jgi:hypothetical protein